LKHVSFVWFLNFLKGGRKISYSDVKFDEALKLLNNAAKEKRGDLMKMITNKYQNFKELIEEVVSDKKKVESAVLNACELLGPKGPELLGIAHSFLHLF